MFWFFSLITQILFLTQLPLVFLIVLGTFILTAFTSLSLSCYAITQRFSIIPLIKASSLFVVLAFIPLFLLAYFLYLPNNYPMLLKQIMGMAALCLPFMLLVSILRYYLQLPVLKTCLILILSVITQLAFILMIGALSAWANQHGWHLNLDQSL